MNVQADVVAEAVNVVLAEPFTMQILAVGIDIVVGNFVEALVTGLAEIHSGFQRGEDGILRSENDVIDFALARREFSVCGKSARDVGGVAGELRANIDWAADAP